ncbi:MAG: signal peptidase II [Phycisphaerae bacterium]|nr:signal peptidase II [Phycisphaerae bacterium]
MLARMRNYIKKVKYPSLHDHLIFWPIIIAGVTADLWSKTAVFKWLGWQETPNKVYHVIEGFFTIVMRVNKGAAFSIATGRTVMLLSVSIIALFVVVGIFMLGNIRHKVMEVALALFTAGIIGNLYDRAFNDGQVRDFLDFYVGDHHWPAFNVADSMLCVAVGLLVIFNFKHSGDTEALNANDETKDTEV